MLMVMQKIERTSPTVAILSNASYTTCPPGEAPAWRLQADRIELNQETGRGVTTTGTKLYVKIHLCWLCPTSISQLMTGVQLVF